jgi:uncharacterized repeat protein (TIGR03803 family)
MRKLWHIPLFAGILLFVLIPLLQSWPAAPFFVSAQTTSGPSFTTLYNFCPHSGCADGNHPDSGLIQGVDGNLYGITDYGGTNNVCYLGCGTVFKITTLGALTSLHSFDSTDGDEPASIIQGANGNFYGATGNGAAHNDGTLFEITPRGLLTTLLNFSTEGPGALVQGADGNFYGMTNFGGGANNNCPQGCGTIFKVTPTGALSTLHNFRWTDGAYPEDAALALGTDGNLYGVTCNGGTTGWGTAFRLTPKGVLTTLHSFGAPADGRCPLAGLIQGTDGSFYGTTVQGGADGYGTVFKMTPAGAETILHSFYTYCVQSSCTGGNEPSAPLIQATDGNFYGTTRYGGTSTLNNNCPLGCGTVFKITPSGSLTTLHNFSLSDGGYPITPLMQDTNGTFYGTTFSGGSSPCPDFAGQPGCGTFFRLSVGLAPFVKTEPASGKVGTAVKILGTNLTGSTMVTFNTTQAKFTVVSPTLITATVPAGATTGKVHVTMPAHTLASNTVFRVLP